MQIAAANRLSCPFLPRSGDLGRGTNWAHLDNNPRQLCRLSFQFHVGHNAEKNSIRKGLARTLTHRERVGKIACDSTHPPEQRFKPIR